MNETATFGNKKANAGGMGVAGYEIKLWHHDVDKPLSYGIHKDRGKPRHFLDDILR